jgi:hypothetical protein
VNFPVALRSRTRRAREWRVFACTVSVIFDRERNCLVLRAEEEVVGRIRHEKLVAHIAGCQATSGGIRGSRPTLGVQALNKCGFGEYFTASWSFFCPDCRQ